MDEHIVLRSGNELRIKHSIVDDNKRNLTWWINKHNNYATREAIDILNTRYRLINEKDKLKSNFFGNQAQKKRALKLTYSHIPLFIRPFLYFIYRYIIKVGFLDGKVGLIYCILHAFWYRFLVDSKIYEASKKCSSKLDYFLYFKNEHGIDITNISKN